MPWKNPNAYAARCAAALVCRCITNHGGRFEWTVQAHVHNSNLGLDCVMYAQPWAGNSRELSHPRGSLSKSGTVYAGGVHISCIICGLVKIKEDGGLVFFLTFPLCTHIRTVDYPASLLEYEPLWLLRSSSTSKSKTLDLLSSVGSGIHWEGSYKTLHPLVLTPVWFY